MYSHMNYGIIAVVMGIILIVMGYIFWTLLKSIIISIIGQSLVRIVLEYIYYDTAQLPSQCWSITTPTFLYFAADEEAYHQQKQTHYDSSTSGNQAALKQT